MAVNVIGCDAGLLWMRFVLFAGERGRKAREGVRWDDSHALKDPIFVTCLPPGSLTLTEGRIPQSGKHLHLFIPLRNRHHGTSHHRRDLLTQPVGP